MLCTCSAPHEALSSLPRSPCLPACSTDLGYDTRAEAYVYACEGIADPDPSQILVGASEPLPASQRRLHSHGDGHDHGHSHGHVHSHGAGHGLPGLPRALKWTAASAAVPDTSATTDAFTLHSRPGAPKVILLDFDGHVTTGEVACGRATLRPTLPLAHCMPPAAASTLCLTLPAAHSRCLFPLAGTSWNSGYNGGSAITTPRYDIDGDATSFSQQELLNIIAIWRAVAEDFAAFNVRAV